MATHKFPGSTDMSLFLNNHITHLGTGGIAHRVEMLDELSDDFCELRMLAFSLAGCLDAPELLPSGQTVRRAGFPAYNVHTKPGSVNRLSAQVQA